jgi:hypothetical protein
VFVGIVLDAFAKRTFSYSLLLALPLAIGTLLGRATILLVG